MEPSGVTAIPNWALISLGFIIAVSIGFLSRLVEGVLISKFGNAPAQQQLTGAGSESCKACRNNIESKLDAIQQGQNDMRSEMTQRIDNILLKDRSTRK
jgi:hypothetical protein